MENPNEATVEWHQAQRSDVPGFVGVTVELGQTRDGQFWIAPCGTQPPSYPPGDDWVYLGKTGLT